MGNAFVNALIAMGSAVHPHVHGERHGFREFRDVNLGSSPRAWGTLHIFGRLCRALRFIPTCMGNATQKHTEMCGKPVHPHVHGERFSFTGAPPTGSGSSPRAWGTPLRYRWMILIWRFIPTCMGNAMASDFLSPLRSVHPHVHGERYAAMTATRTMPGSSPRAWGTLMIDEVLTNILRFIPTCMGNADTTPDRSLAGSVHPHVHGERHSTLCPPSEIAGSSPRAWGTP